MRELVENFIKALNDPNTTEEAKELIRDLLRQQADHEKDLLDLIYEAIDDINYDLPI